jgi:SRSO17 transposase
MDRRFDTRLREMLAQAEVSPELIDGLLSRLETFVHPFTACLREPEQHLHTVEYVTGLLSKLEHKTGEGVAYLHDQERQGIQKFIGQVPWDHAPLLTTLTRQVGEDLGETDGVIVFDPSAFAKKGTKSVGVARQWCGRLGKVENCQVGIYMAYASRKEHAFITRERQANKTFNHNYYLSNADSEVPLEEYARVAKAEHRIEECLQRAKGEAGLGDYQVRNWTAWHHHQTLALLAAWFLNQETRRGKNTDTCADMSPTEANDRRCDRAAPRRQPSVGAEAPRHALVGTQRVCSLLSSSFS